jgi:three-Cys-motif partner protein
MVALSDYTGREQSYVKHVFLERCLERLVYKTASVFDHIVYVDGFAGPWQSANEKLEDTSFGIALNALRRAKASYKERNRSVKMSAFLVEQDPEPYRRLAEVPARFPDIDVRTYGDDFLVVMPKILGDIAASAFTFFLIDPKGWSIPLKTLTPLLARPNSEVILNFMFDFINRAASIKDPLVVAGLDQLIPKGNWRVTLEAAESANPEGLSSEGRKAILVEAFASNLAKLGSYTYVAETTVLRPVSDRTLYCLFYATRHAKGIEVFRDSQVEALKEQSVTRAAVKLKQAQAKSGQAEIFRSLHDMGPDDLTAFLNSERVAAEKTLLALTPSEPDTIRYDKLRPLVLARHVVRNPDVNRIAARLRREGKLLIPDWEKGKQVPQPSYRIHRPKV